MTGLVVKDLSIFFGGIQALKNVSIEVRPGEVVGLIGPNGAGKTTLLNCISRYYKPSSGQISFNGVNLLRKRPSQLLALSVARSFQDLDFQPALNVMDNLLVGQHHNIKTSVLRGLINFNYLKKEERTYRRRSREIMRLFAEMRVRAEKPQKELGFPDISGKGGYPDLLDVENVPITMLPYGMRKRADLARALVSDPKLLLLDEPASGLGATDLDEMINLIGEVRSRKNMSILLVEHKMPLVMSLCSRIIVLDFGEKIAEGSPQEIQENPLVIEAYLGKKTALNLGTVSADSARVASPALQPDLERPILEVKGIDLFYGSVQALSGVNMKIPDRCITAILGSNGAGKSSLLKSISAVERLSNGEIHFAGECLIHWLQAIKPDQVVRRGIIQVPEGRRILKELSVMENLQVAGYTCKSRAKMKQNIEKVFHYFPKLKEKLKLRDAGNLSGGQQQMLAIGQALMMEPRVLLLDEPSLGLSPNLVDEVFEIIRQINLNEKCPIVIVEQNTEAALQLSNYAYVLETGFVIKQGISQDLSGDDEIRMIYLGAKKADAIEART